MNATFLGSIAGAYRHRYDDLSRLVFVMPNKRSCTFLLREIASLSERATIAPQIMTITDFIHRLADGVPDSRIDLICRLYTCYRELSGSEKDLPFDRFCSFGETILSDFNEIDMQMVDAEEIFKNVYDLNAIRSNFLTPEQRKVMVEYFGYSTDFLEVELKRFWQNFEDLDPEKPGVRQKFSNLWQLLLPLYEKFKESLRADGLTSEGEAYRQVCEKVEDGFEPFPGSKIVFAGFNALSESEVRIFRALKQMEVTVSLRTGEEATERKADFIWDMAPEMFVEPDEPALKFVNYNRKKDNFPSPEWIKDYIRRSIPDKLPEIKVIAVPSNVMQAKVAGEELKSLFAGASGDETEKEEQRQSVEEDIRDARIAVVLTDENLLLPMLHSLPKEFSHPNLTMGFPLRQTPVVSFMALLRKLFAGAISSGKEILMRFEDLKDFLGHPYSQLLFTPEKIDTLIQDCEKRRKIMVTSRVPESLGEDKAFIFHLPVEETSASAIIGYLLEVLKKVNEALKKKEEGAQGYLRNHIEKVYVGTYTDALIRLGNSLRKYRFEMTGREVFMLADRLIAGESVVFDGRPLEGLQIMGVLETRCLDFDRVIILSVNEKVIPRVARATTFVPNIIRSAFGMPPANYQEEIFAYYFYRVLGRCESAVLTYDSRASENRTPGPSRYILQLKYLCEGVELKEEEAAFSLPPETGGSIEIEKLGEIKEALERYIVPEKKLLDLKETKVKNFSASALNHYFNCPVQFLYADVLRLGEERDKIETIDAIDFGTIVHRIIEHLYFPADKRGKMLERPIVATKEFLRGFLDESPSGRETRIERETRLAILNVHFGIEDSKAEKAKLQGSAIIIADYIHQYVRNIIEADIQQAPFRLWGSEISRTFDYTLPACSTNGEEKPRTVRLKMIIDRLDQEGPEGEDGSFRIVDYKTGGVHLVADEFGQVFDSTYEAKNIFQLFFYSSLLIYAIEKGEISLPDGWDKDEMARKLKMVIYKIPALPAPEGIVAPAVGQYPDEKGKLQPNPRVTMADLRDLEKEEGVRFFEKLDATLREILNPSSSFAAEPTEQRCKYCDFRLRCEVGRK